RLAEPTDDPEAIEVLVPANSARVAQLKPGDRIVASHAFDDCNRPPPPNSPEEAADSARFRCQPQQTLRLEVTLTVAGIVEQVDPSDGYWAAGRMSFATPIETETQGPIVNVILPEESFYGPLVAALAGVPSLFQVSSFADLASIDSADLPRATASIDTLRSRIQERGGLTDSPMGAALAQFER